MTSQVVQRARAPQDTAAYRLAADAITLYCLAFGVGSEQTMCSLCGVLGAANHWTDAAARPEAFAGREGTRTQERRGRVALANRVLRHYALKLAEWQGQYVLRSATGRVEVVPDVVSMWSAAEKLATRPCDPLDPDLIAALQRE